MLGSPTRKLKDSSSQSLRFHEKVSQKLIPISPERRQKLKEQEKEEEQVFNQNTGIDALVSAYNQPLDTINLSSTGIEPVIQGVLSDDHRGSILDQLDIYHAYITTSNQLEPIAEQKIQELATQAFPNDAVGREFAAQIIRKCFFSSTKMLTTVLTTTESATQQRENIFNTAVSTATAWLEQVKLADLVKYVRQDVEGYYTKNSFEALAFERYILARFKQLQSSEAGNYTDAANLYNSVSTQILQKKFSLLLDGFNSFGLTHRFEYKLFPSFFMAHIENLFCIKDIPALDKADFPNYFEENIQAYFNKNFLGKITTVVNTFLPSTPLWMIFYVLDHHAQEIFLSLTPEKVAAERFMELYAKVHQKNGEMIAQNFIKDLLASKISANCYFNKDAKTGQLSFKTIEELQDYAAYWGLNNRFAALEIACFLMGSVSLTLTILMATQTIKPILAPNSDAETFAWSEFASCFLFGFFGLFGLIAAYALCKERLNTLRDTQQTLEMFTPTPPIYSNRTGSQLYAYDPQRESSLSVTRNPLLGGAFKIKPQKT